MNDGRSSAGPDAALKYSFFTPYHRGFSLVFDFLCAQPDGRFSRGPFSIQASYGYERARETRVFAEDQYVGTAHSLSDRFAAIVHAYRDFMRAVEAEATEWQSTTLAAKEGDAERAREDDKALCERVIAASGDAHAAGATPKRSPNT